MILPIDRTKSAVLSAAAGIALTACSCAVVNDQTLAQNIANAARPSSLPALVSCWEKEFEASELRAAYVVTTSFMVESGTSRIRDAKVTAVDPSKDTPPHDTKPFVACIEDALNRSTLPTSTNSDGPGFTHSSDVVVRGYRIAFVDPSRDRRRAASERQAYVLLGPRSERCQGLYTHEPPRDVSTLYNEIASIEEMASRYKDNDQTLYAREIQKVYDVRLELRERLTLDLADPLLPDANKKRMKKALDDIEVAAKKTGAMIGCSPPSRPQP